MGVGRSFRAAVCVLAALSLGGTVLGCGGGDKARPEASAGASSADGAASAGTTGGATSGGVDAGGGGSAAGGRDGDVGAPEVAAITLNQPVGLIFDDDGRLLLADAPGSFDDGGRIISIDLATDTGVVVALHGSSPAWIAGDGAATIFFSTDYDNAVKEVSLATGAVTFIAGSLTRVAGLEDAVGAAALFDRPQGLVDDRNGNLYVVEWDNDTVRKIALATGSVTTLAGAAMQAGYHDDTGGAARFNEPRDLTYDEATGAVYVSDAMNCSIRRVDVTTGVVTTLAGDGVTCAVHDAVGSAAAFDVPGPLVSDGKGTLYVADQATIREIVLSTGEVTTIAGTADLYAARDGTGADGTFGGAQGLALDGKGHLYISDCGTIRKLDLATHALVTLYGDPTNGPLSIVGCGTKGQRVLWQAP